MSAEMVSLARRALTHYENQTTDQADSTMVMPVDAYIGEARYRAEVERIFKHLPLALALSLELPEPGCYRALTVLNVPVLLVRGARSELIEDEHVREYQELVPHGTVIDVRGAGHMVAGDRNDVFGDAVIAYLGGLNEADRVAPAAGKSL